MPATERTQGSEVATSPLQLSLSAWRSILARTWVQMMANNVTLVAAGVAFYGFLAFVPLLAATVLLFGLVADITLLSQSAQTLLRFMPPEAAVLVIDQLNAVIATSSEQKGLGLLVALTFALYGAMQASSAIIMALNIAFGETEQRSFLRVLATQLGLTIGLVLAVLIGAVVVSIYALATAALSFLPVMVLLAVRIATWVVAIAALSLLLAAIYRYAPDRPKAQWQWISPGSIASTIGGGIILWLFGLYVASFGNYTATYGALVAIVVFLLWLWLSALLLCAGAELNAEVARHTTVSTTLSPDETLVV